MAVRKLRLDRRQVMSIDRHFEADRNSVNAISFSFAHVQILTERFCLSIQPSIIKEKRMFTKKTTLRAVGASLAAVLSLAAQPASAQGSDAERLQKLEQAVSQLQKRNAELEQEVAGLKKRTRSEEHTSELQSHSELV